GASGFIGKNFVLMAPRDWEITATFFKTVDFPKFLQLNLLNNVKPHKVNLIDDAEVKDLAKKTGGLFDAILFLAANSNPSYSLDNPLFDLNSNICSLINILERFRCKRFIYLSSGAVYDGLQGLVSPDSNLSPTLPYAISKMASEKYVKFYSIRRKTIEEYVILRFFGAYGPYESPRKIYTRLINSFYFNNNDELIIYGDGKNYIDAMYVEDAINGILKVLLSKEKNITVDFGCGEPITLKELVLRVGKFFGKEIKINFKGEAAEYITWYMSKDQMSRRFGFTPRISLEEGLSKFVKYLDNKRLEERKLEK
ncbi:MAG: NAD(P)-dependent oxidoreductase, partial [Candidatus Omnitrophica bacterium]|nr:NAD(P)-dependent oxidoreductase [Candidatus Omnitrophota bacterium]